MKGKFFAVTGAASGIGRETSLRLSQLGAAGIGISDINVEGLEETKNLCEKYQTKVLTSKVNVADAGEVDEWISQIIRTFGRLDGAANIAGIAEGSGDTLIETIEQKDWDRMIAVNLTGLMTCMRSELKRIAIPGGSIVNVASTAGIRGVAHNAAYSSSKFGAIGLTSSAAAEYGPKGVRINALLPGPIDTKIFRDGEAKGLFNSDILGNATLLKRMGKPDEVAKVLCFLLSDDASYVTGAQWTVDGGFSTC